MSSQARDQGWTREESRWIDGLLDEASARRLEARLAEDPERSARLEAYRDAMSLWRDDTDRRAGTVDTARLAEDVLTGHGLESERAVRAARRYAAAAVLLMGLGLAGASALGPRPAEADGAPLQTALQLIEQDRLALQTAREWESFPLIHTADSAEER